MSAVSIAVTAVVGNPRPGSRTISVGQAVTTTVAESLRRLARPVSTCMIDLGAFGGRVLDPDDAEVEQAVSVVRASDVLIVASPTYKATYTGLLKGFFDRMSNGALSRAVAIPVMVGAAPIHALAVDVHLRPLLVELGATCPVRGLYITEQQLDDLPQRIGAWSATAATVLTAAVSATHSRPDETTA